MTEFNWSSLNFLNDQSTADQNAWRACEEKKTTEEGEAKSLWLVQPCQLSNVIANNYNCFFDS